MAELSSRVGGTAAGRIVKNSKFAQILYEEIQAKMLGISGNWSDEYAANMEQRKQVGELFIFINISVFFVLLETT